MPQSSITIDIYLPPPSAIATLYRLSRFITSEVDRVLEFTTNTIIIDTIRALWPYDTRSRKSERLYTHEDEEIGNWRWMLEEGRRGGGHLEVEGKLVHRYLVTGPVLRSRSRSRSRSPSRSAAGHTPFGGCSSCKGVCLMGAINAEMTRMPSSGRRSLGCGPGCLACSGESSGESEENDLEGILGR